MKLYVIAGHGDGDSGACGNGYQEAERVRALAEQLGRIDGVEVLDTSQNWYETGGISYLNLPDDAQLIELHMDSGGWGACGAHVIYNGNFSPDEYDEALAEFLCGYFPGRSTRLSGRTDLANPNRAASAGISYRLVECGFISDAGDVEKFNNGLWEIAKGIARCFGLISDKPEARSVQLYPLNYTDAQKWRFESKGDDSFVIYPVCSEGKRLHARDTDNGTVANIDIADDVLIAKKEVVYGMDSKIQIMSGNKYLAANAGVSGSGIIFADASAGWVPVWAGESWTYYLLDVKCGLALDVVNAGR